MARKRGFFSGWWQPSETDKLPSDVNLQSAIDRLTQKLEQKDEVLDSLRNQRHQLQSKLQATEEQVKAFQAQAQAKPPAPPPPVVTPDQDVPAEIEQLNQKLAQREQHVESLRDQRNQLKQQLRNAGARLKALEAQLETGDPSAGDSFLSAELKQQEQEIAKLRDARESAQARVRELEQELKRARAETEGAGAQTTNQLVADVEAAAEARIRELETELEKAHSGEAAVPSDNEHQSQALEEARREAENIRQRIQTLEAELVETRASAEAGRARLSEQHSQATGLFLAEKEAAKARAKELEAQLKEALARADAAVSSGSESLAQALEEARRDAGNAWERVQALEVELARTRSSAETERAVLSQEHTQATHRLLMQKEAAEARAREMEAELKEALTNVGATLTTQSKQQSKALEEARRQAEDARRRVQALEIELAEVRTSAEADRAALTKKHEQTLHQLRQEKEEVGGRIRELEKTLSEDRARGEAAPGEPDSNLLELETDLRRHKNALEALQRKNEELTKQLQSARWKTEDGGASARIQELEVALKKGEDRILDLKDDLQVWKTLADQLELTQKEAAAPTPAAVKSTAEVDLTPELKTTFPQQEPEEKLYDAATASAGAAPLPPSEAPKREAAPAAPVQPSPPAPAAAVPARKKLLVAEDDPAIRRIVEITLQKEGIEVISAENGQEGLQMAIDQQPDAVLTDIQMPVMTGIELAEKLRSNPATRTIPVGFLTGQREVGYYKQALALGSTIYITKPFRPDQLMMFINILFRGKKPRFGRSAAKPSAS